MGEHAQGGRNHRRTATGLSSSSGNCALSVITSHAVKPPGTRKALSAGLRGKPPLTLRGQHSPSKSHPDTLWQFHLHCESWALSSPEFTGCFARSFQASPLDHIKAQLASSTDPTQPSLRSGTKFPFFQLPLSRAAGSCCFMNLSPYFVIWPFLTFWIQ